MVENHLRQQKYLIVAECAEEPDDILENMTCVVFASEKKQMLENSHESENQVGKIQDKKHLVP